MILNGWMTHYRLFFWRMFQLTKPLHHGWGKPYETLVYVHIYIYVDSTGTRHQDQVKFVFEKRPHKKSLLVSPSFENTTQSLAQRTPSSRSTSAGNTSRPGRSNPINDLMPGLSSSYLLGINPSNSATSGTRQFSESSGRNLCNGVWIRAHDMMIVGFKNIRGSIWASVDPNKIGKCY